VDSSECIEAKNSRSGTHVSQDFHFGILDAEHYPIPHRSCLFIAFFLAAPATREGTSPLPFRTQETSRRPHSDRQRQCDDPPNHASKQSPGQMALRQESEYYRACFAVQPSVTSRHLQVGQRSVLDSLGQGQPPPQVPGVNPSIETVPACDTCSCSRGYERSPQPKPHFVGPKPVAAQPCHFRLRR